MTGTVGEAGNAVYRASDKAPVAERRTKTVSFIKFREDMQLHSHIEVHSDGHACKGIEIRLKTSAKIDKAAYLRRI